MTGGPGPKRKGDGWERAVVAYLTDRGYHAHRLYGAGRPDDVGDLYVDAWVPLLTECKNARRPERARWIDDAYAKVENDEIPMIVEKRPRRPDPADAYATFSLRGAVDLLDYVAKRAAALARGEPA